jgi:UDP-glucose 4-epimerase
LDGLKVLMVGGAGYIGSHCAQLLADQGHEIVVYDDLSTGIREAAVGRLVVGDILDHERLVALLRAERFDAIMHFAARLLVGESVEHPLRYFDTNVAGTLSLLRAMAAAGPRVLVFSSTCATYGNPRYLPLDEAHPSAPVNPYGASKAMVETILSNCREREDFRVMSLRYFNAAGCHPRGIHGESHTPETHLIPLTLEAATGRRVLQVYGRDYDTPDGTCIRDYVHVLDIAEAHRLALKSLLAGDRGRAYNIGTGKGSTVLEVITSVERVTGLKVERVDAPARDGDPPALYASSALIERDLGWKARYVSLDEIIASAWRWFQQPRYGRLGPS